MAVGEWDGVECDGFGADPGAAAFIGVEGDLGSGGGDDLAATDDPRAGSQRAGTVARVVLGYSHVLRERRNAQPHPQQASD